ncbi:hypothetical protein ACLSYV_04730 [Avibacterium avium]|uniref:hypothetical protein n=1 Tax=Avibacterium avium TaxID=751 RepID=UPI003BF90E04
MKVYQSSVSTDNIPVLGHFSTVPEICAMRISSMFSNKNRAVISKNKKNTLLVVNIFSSMGREMRLQDYFIEFSHFANEFLIQEYILDVKKPLKLIDCWQDDPIGSVGIKAIDAGQIDKTSIDVLKKDLLKYSPYLGLALPPVFPSNQMANHILDKRQSDKVFHQELSKRINRSKQLGEDFEKMRTLELVWLESTFLIKEWAEKLGYDSFFYSNSAEGNGQSCFMPLKEEQIKKTGKYFSFIIDKYQRNIPKLTKDVDNNAYKENRYFLWGDCDAPMKYWKCKTKILSKLRSYFFFW